MLRIVITVDAPAGQAVGAKEQLAMLLEHWGDTHVVSVEEIKEKQMELEDMK